MKCQVPEVRGAEESFKADFQKRNDFCHVKSHVRAAIKTKKFPQKFEIVLW
jgi:hypothetical protein